MAGLSILELLSEEPEGLGVTDIARELSADKGNTHRILKVLQERDYVAQDPLSKQYTISARVLQLAGMTLRRLDVRNVAEPTMERLQNETGESVHLTVRTGSGAVYVAQSRGLNQVHVETGIGSVAPLHCTATGKSIAAHLPAEVLSEVLADSPYRAFTKRTITSRRRLDKELALVRKRGYSFDDQEYVVDVRGVGAPIIGAHGQVVAAMGISGPVSRMTDDRVVRFAKLITQAAGEVTAAMGGAAQ